MKTRFKTSSKSQKDPILENSNFLNNQNYVLGKSEKKKILSKFLTENTINNFLSKLSWFLWFFSYRFFWIFLLLILMLLWDKYISNAEEFKIFVIFNILPILTWLSLIFIKNKKYNNKISFTSYFYDEYRKWIWKYFGWLISIVLWMSIPFWLLAYLITFKNFEFWWSVLKFLWFVIPTMIYFFVVIIINMKFLSNIRYFNLLLAPFMFLYWILYYIYQYILNSILNINNNMYILKKQYKSNYLNKFIFKKRLVWENKNYKIQLKK